MLNSKMNNYAVIILAAGQSKRLGRAKQLVPYKGKTLLNRAIETAFETKIENIFVVMGAHFEEIKASVANKNIFILKNENFEQGMASSIQCGLRHIISLTPHIENVIFMVCDQPFVDSDLLLNLIAVHKKSDLPIVASQYNEVLGTPALFNQSFFNQLLNLKGDAGAGKLIKQNLKQVAVAPFENGFLDIDTQEDIKFLL